MTPMSLADISGETIQKTIKEYETLGQDAFLKKYGYQRSVVYFLQARAHIVNG